MTHRWSRAKGRLSTPNTVEWLCLLAGSLLVIRYAWLMDDSYVFFRYVDNLLFLDLGLVYNAGENVEGFSSPLWTLVLIALRATEINYWTLIRGVALVSFAAFWAQLVLLDRWMSPEPQHRLNLPLLILSFHYGTLCYFSSGTESPLLMVATTTIALFIARPDSRALEVMLAFAPLVRHELALPVLLCAAYQTYRTRAFPWRITIATAAVVGSWIAFRIYYYADLFPSTYYLKNLVDPVQGLRYVWDTVLPYGFVFLFGAPLLAWSFLGPVPADRTGDRLTRAVMLIVAASLLPYVIKIGGDARHFRYLIFPFVLAVCSLAGISASLMVWRPGWRRFAAPAAAIVALGSLVAYPRQLLGHPLIGSPGRRFVDKIADAQHHRVHSEIPILRPLDNGDRIELLPAYRNLLARSGPIVHEEVIRSMLCWSIYRRFDKRAVHLLGLTDNVLARSDVESDWPAHKWSLGPLGNDIASILDWYGRPPGLGMFRAAVTAGVAPQWVVDNLETLEVIERKTYNDHRFTENLSLAFAFPSRLAFQHSPLEDVEKPRADGWKTLGGLAKPGRKRGKGGRKARRARAVAR